MKIVFLNPNDLTPYINNTVDHPTEQIDKIAGQIAAFGFDQPIVVDKNKVIIKGHGRREAAIRLGLSEVPVVVAEHLDEYQVMASRIGDNQVATLKKFNTEKLKLELGTLNRNNFNLKLTGFELKPIEDLLNAGEIKTGERTPGIKNGPDKEQPEKLRVVEPDEEDSSGSGDDSSDMDSGDSASVSDGDSSQYIVTITCPDEESMRLLYEELNGRNLDVKLIT